MSEIKAVLSRLETQKEHATTLRRSLDEYNTLVRTQHDLNLPCHAFFTANVVLDPFIGDALEYSKQNLGKYKGVDSWMFQQKQSSCSWCVSLNVDGFKHYSFHPSFTKVF